MLDEQAGVRKVINDKLSVNKEKRVISWKKEKKSF
jgi:hypothetical protein